MSSGVVSGRTRIVASSCAAAACAASAVKTMRPVAAPGAGGEAGAEDVARRGRVDLRVQVLDQAARLDAQQRLVAADGADVGEVDDDPHRGAAGAADRGDVDDRGAVVFHHEIDADRVAEADGGPAGGRRQGVARPCRQRLEPALPRGPGLARWRCGRKPPLSAPAPVRLSTSCR